MNEQRKEIILFLSVTLLVLIGLFLRTDRLTYSDPDFTKIWDHTFYIEMATNHPSNLHIAPFEYRILNPLLAKFLPFDLIINFTILSFTALWLTGIITYFMLRTMGFSIPLAFTGLLFFLSLGWATRYNIWDFWLSDPMGFLFIVAAIWSIFAKKDLIFLLLLAIGVSAKENVIFVAPLYYTFNAKKMLDSKVLFRSLILVAPALLILLALRIYIPTTNDGYNVANLFQTIGSKRIQQLLKDTGDYLLLYSIGTFGVSLIFLPLFSIKQNLSLFLRFSPFFVLAYSSLLFAYNTERLIVSAFPAVIIMALYGIKSIADKTGSYGKIFIFLPLSLIALLLIKKEWHIVSSLYEALILLLFLALSYQSDWLIKKIKTA
jgi:hypothetical protein